MGYLAGEMHWNLYGGDCGTSELDRVERNLASSHCQAPFLPRLMSRLMELDWMAEGGRTVLSESEMSAM